MVDLVLEDPGLEAGGLEADRVAVGVEPGDRDVQRALDVHRDPRQAEAALLGDHEVVRAPLDLGVDQRRRLGIVAGLEDEQATQHAELGGGQADAQPVAHDRDHPLDLGVQLLAEAGDRRCPALQHRIAELDDVREGGFAALDYFVFEFGALFLAGADGLVFGAVFAHPLDCMDCVSGRMS